MANVDYRTSGIVTAPVVLTSVATLLGTNIKDLGRLCTSGKINKWSRYKPTIYQSINGGKTHGGSQWKGNNGQCGLDFSGALTTSTVASTIADKVFNDPKSKWIYQPPTGGASSMYRLGDFEGYFHNAECPIADPQDTVIYREPASGGAYSISFTVDVIGPSGEYNLHFSDLSYNGVSLSNYYLGMILKIGSRYVLGTASSPISDTNTFNVTIGTGSADLGECQLGLFLSNKTISINGSAQSGSVIIALPTETATIVIRKGSGESGGGTFNYYAEGSYEGRVLTAYLHLINYSSSAKTSSYTLEVGRYKRGKLSEASDFTVVKTTPSVSCADGTSSDPGKADYEYSGLTLPTIPDGYLYCIRAVAQDITDKGEEATPLEEVMEEV